MRPETLDFLVKHVLLIALLLFIMYKALRATMTDWIMFVNSLHSPGAGIIVAYLMIITGIVMMKIMLYDDGKYIVGGGATLLVKQLDGKTPANREEQEVRETHITEVHDK